ncbi:MAG TPA: helicase, partial [Spirochaetales bacterium]|nr:helicase [Spirochaetales bacterium]
MNLKDKLSHLTFNKACKLLGPEGAKLIRKGGKWEIDLEDQVKLNNEKFELDLGEAVVLIRLNPANNQRLHLSCSACSSLCEHQGAALSLILEEK